MQRGFSLVELSIVLVILGLLTGGILAGQSLIRAAELRGVSTEYNKWSSAYNTFRDKYFSIPGDFTKATDFWAPPGGNIANCPATAGTGTQTCNGDGDGMISGGPVNQYGEAFMFWQHLANAGLIEGTYTGINGSGSSTHATATNAPRGKLSNSYWHAFYWQTPMVGNSSAFDGSYPYNQVQMGGLTSNGSPATPLLKPEESWNIDTKLDDGRPAYGIMRERFWDDCTDAGTSAAISASYALTVTMNVCVPIFKIQ